MDSIISDLFKNDTIPPNQLSGKNALEVLSETANCSPEADITEDEAQLLDAFKAFTNTYDFNILIDFHEQFKKFTDIGYSILLENNFFDIFVDYIKALRTTSEVNQALETLICFTRISSEINEQILGNFNDALNYYLYELGDIRDLSLSLCINFSSFPTIAGSKYFNYDDTKISYLSIIYKYSPHARQREQIIEIYKNLSKIDIHQYETFIQSIFTEKYMVEILSLTSTIKLLRYLGQKAISDERFNSQVFISNLKNALSYNIENSNQKYVKNCLKFINIRCSNCLEAVSYYEIGFSEIFLQLPDDFMDYICLIYIGIFKKVPDSIEDSSFLEVLIKRLDIIAHTGNISHKIAAIKLVSKMIFIKRELSQNETILNIIIDSFELLLSFDLITVLKFLDLLILVCQWERENKKKIVINKIIENNIPALLNEISDNINELMNENDHDLKSFKEIKYISEINDMDLHLDQNIGDRTKILYDIIFKEDESDA